MRAYETAMVAFAPLPAGLLLYTYAKPMRARISSTILLIAVPALLCAQTPTSPTHTMTSKKVTAAEVEKSALIIDTHADTPQRFVDEGFNLGDPLNGGNLNLDSIHKGNLGAEFF